MVPWGRVAGAAAGVTVVAGLLSLIAFVVPGGFGATFRFALSAKNIFSVTKMFLVAVAIAVLAVFFLVAGLVSTLGDPHEPWHLRLLDALFVLLGVAFCVFSSLAAFGAIGIGRMAPWYPDH